MNIRGLEMPTRVVTGVALDPQGRVARVRWYLAEVLEEVGRGRSAPRPLTAESVVGTLEVIDKLLDAEAVVPLFPGPEGPLMGSPVKVHLLPDGTESIEVDPSLPGQRLRDLPRL